MEAARLSAHRIKDENTRNLALTQITIASAILTELKKLNTSRNNGVRLIKSE
jgi:hypothetical protein